MATDKYHPSQVSAFINHYLETVLYPKGANGNVAMGEIFFCREQSFLGPWNHSCLPHQCQEWALFLCDSLKGKASQQTI